MNTELFQKFVKANPVIAILRGVTPDEVVEVCGVLHDAGINLVEIPLNSPDAIESIRRAAETYHDGRMFIGAGTVLTVDDVRQVADAGGKYIISPNSNPEVIRVTKVERLVSIPGFLTPTEAFSALAAGADYLKLFPAATMGLTYVKDLKAVIKSPIMAVGGIGPDNVADYLKCCAGVGIGSSLYKSGKTIEQLKKDAAKLMANVKGN